MSAVLAIGNVKQIVERIRVRCKTIFTRRVRKPNMHDRVFQLIAKGLSGGDAIDAMLAERARTPSDAVDNRPQIGKERA